MSTRFRLDENGFYRMINTAFLVCIALFGAGGYFGISTPKAVHVICVLTSVSFLTVLYYMPLRGRILCIPGLIGFLCVTAAIFGFAQSGEFLLSYVRWLLNISPWERNWIIGYQVIQTLLLVIICYILQIIFEQSTYIKEAAALLLLAGLLYSLFTETENSPIGVAFTICFLVMVFVERTQRNWVKTKGKSLQAYMVWITPFLLLYLALLIWTPTPDEPYDWQIVRDIYHNLQETVKTISRHIMNGDKEEYDLGLSGFSDDADLGSGILEEDKEIMTIQGNNGLKTNVYLIGKVFDTFDGKQWQQLSTGVPFERYIDTVETLYAVENYDEKYKADYLAITKLDICYQDFNSSYLFAPLKTTHLRANAKNLTYEDREGSLHFEEKKGYGTEYEATFYQMNMDQQAFYEFLETTTEPDESLLADILDDMNSTSGKKITVDDVKNYQQMIYTEYLDEVMLSGEVKDYLQEVTQYASTDLEKLKIIEALLSSYTYNHAPGALPDSVTDSSRFLDYFLLESKQGYCSYFATAFVLLARAEGIPARYVQGYCVPVPDSKQVTVTSDMAHAWPEVYLENIGWIPFEPTPGYGQYRYTSWATQRDESSSTGHGSGYSSIVTEVESDYEEDEIVGNMTDLSEIEKEEEWIGSAIYTEIVTKHLPMILSMSVLVISLFLAVFLLDYLINSFRYRRMNENQKYLHEMRKNFKILSWLDVKLQDGETLDELQERMESVLTTEDTFNFLKIYEEFLYGNKDVEPQMLQLTKEEQFKLAILLKDTNKVLYLYYKVFMKGERV